jgi:hypothetical protein
MQPDFVLYSVLDWTTLQVVDTPREGVSWIHLAWLVGDLQFWSEGLQELHPAPLTSG